MADHADIGRSRQRAIYVAGIGGNRPAVPVGQAELEKRAQAAMSPEAWAYVAGGAGREATMDANRAAFDRWRIVPRVLRNVESRDLSIELFGRRLPAPLLLCPIGVLELVHREADLAVARAAGGERVGTSAARAGIPAAGHAGGDRRGARTKGQLSRRIAEESAVRRAPRGGPALRGDVFASAVCLGRPYVHGLALAGQRGVEEVIGNVLAEFDLTLGLAGCASIRQVGREAVGRADRP